jgi:hypothetical protein
VSGHDHDLDYAEKYHRHYDGERELAAVRRDLDRVIGDLRELRGELEAALGRIRDLEAQTPEARQAELEADIARADAAASGYDDEYPDDEPDDESWRGTLADYHVASGGADYDEDGPDCGCGLGAARCRALEDGEVPE